MTPLIIRERLHFFIDTVPVNSLNEIYQLLSKDYGEKCKTVFLEQQDLEISKAEADLFVQQFLA